jgi:hypothetical protein
MNSQEKPECYSLGLDAPPMVHLVKVWSLLGGDGAWWEVLRSLGYTPNEDLRPFLFFLSVPSHEVSNSAPTIMCQQRSREVEPTNHGEKPLKV